MLPHIGRSVRQQHHIPPIQLRMIRTEPNQRSHTTQPKNLIAQSIVIYGHCNTKQFNLSNRPVPPTKYTYKSDAAFRPLPLSRPSPRVFRSTATREGRNPFLKWLLFRTYTQHCVIWPEQKKRACEER